MSDDDKAIRAAKLTLGGMLDKKRAKEARERAGGQIAPSKYLPDVPRQAHADGGRVYPLDDRSGWYGDANYEQTGGKMVMMSPDEYLSKVRPLDIDETSRDNIDDLKQHILSGRKLDPLKIDAQGREDGRHRAHAARELGIKQVPVLTWPRAERASGGYVPAATLPVPRRLAVAAPLQPASAQPSALEALAGLAGTASKIGDTATGLFGEKGAEQHHPNDGHDHGPATAPSADNGGMSEAALAAWSGLTDAWGQPLTVTSAYRDPKRNEEVGGAKDSQHMHGNAYDVDTSHLSYDERLALADAAWNAGFRGIGFYDNSMHFDVADPRAWGPSHSRDSIPEWALPWATQRYGYADGGEVTDLGQVREQKQLQGFHKGMMDDLGTRMNNAMDAHQKAVDAGVFDGYEVGDVLKGSAHPMRITGRFMRKWKPTPMALGAFERMGAKPTIVEHEGEQYIPMLRYETGVEGEDGWQRGDAYLDGVKAAGYQKMGGLRAVKADGGAIHLIHGGADFDEIDPRFSGTGEPGGIRPLGKGLYTFVLDPDDPEKAKNSIEWAKHYATKYGRGKKTLHVFQVPKSASTMFNGPRSIDGLGAEPQEKLAAYRAHRDAEPAKDDPAWWDWSRKGNALYEDVKNAADLRLEHLPIGLTEAAINNPKIAQRVGKFDPEADPDEIIKAIRGYADGGSVDDLPLVGKNRNGVPEDDAVASPLRKAEYPYMSMTPARQAHADALRQAINKAHAEAKEVDLPIDQIVTDVSAIGRSRVKNPAGGLPFVERINGVHHLRDGNHRVAAAMLRGDKTVRALVADMDEAIKSSGRANGGAVPQKTVKAYKLFRTKGDGKLYPLFVNADKPVPMGEWIDAEEGPQGKTQGRVKSKIGDLAYRPGWHAGDLPVATHIGGKSSPDLKAPDYRPDNHVWAEVEMPNDVDWQSEANARAKVNKAGQPILNTAHITDQLPKGGFYRYKTNPNMTGNWLIGGSMKVNRVLSDDEVKAINDQAGVADLPRLDRTEKADGGSVAERSPMFEGMHEDLYNEDGKPTELWHGTPAAEPFEAFDDSKLGSQRDHGFYGRGHYLTPDAEQAAEYAGDSAEEGTLMGPLHAALKNPYIWDASDNGSHRTLRDLQSMGIMREKSELEPWDNLQRHHIDPFMREMQKRGHDGVLMKTNRGLSEVVVFNPNMIKHRDAEVGDPNDPRIMRATGGKVDLYSKAARIIRGMKDQPMPVDDIVKYALGKGVKKAEIDHSDIPSGKARPSQVAEHIEFMQPDIGVNRRGDAINEYRRMMDGDMMSYTRDDFRRMDQLEREAFMSENRPQYAQYQLPGGENYREHVLTLDNHPDDQTYMARAHWGDMKNPLAHIRMSDRKTPDGRKLLHIEEMQSDWNNAARYQGFRTGREKQDYDDFVEDMRNQMIARVNARTGQDYYDPMTGEVTPTMSPMVAKAQIEKYKQMDPYTLALKLGVQDRHNQMARAANEKTMAPPRAPYINPKRDDWAELAMKHVLTEAAKGGYDGVTFTPDAAQSQRWGGTNFDGIYDKKLPGLAHRLVQQHDPSVQTDQVGLPNTTTPSAVIPLTDTARSSIMKNSFPAFRRGGYVTHVRRAR